MNQRVATKSQPNFHLVSTALIGIVCLASLGAAAVGLYNSRSAKLDLCSVVAQQVWGVQSTVQNDRHFIPRGIKNGVLQTVDAGQALMAKHCPPEALKPPEPEKAGNPHEILKQFMGMLVE